MKSFLFNPINGICEPATYKEIQGFTGMSISAISKAKKNKTRIKSLNGLFVVDDSFTEQDFKELKESFFDINEVWAEIPGYPRYFVSNLGRVKSVIKRERLLSPYLKKKESLFVKIVNDKKIKEVHIHRLVADAFVPKSNNTDVIYHKDGNLKNNDCNNLCWVSKQELGRLTGKLSKGMPVIKIDKNTGEELDHYESMAEAGRCNYMHRETIRLAVSGKLNTAGGYKWVIDEEFNKKKSSSVKLLKRTR